MAAAALTVIGRGVDVTDGSPKAASTAISSAGEKANSRIAVWLARDRLFWIIGALRQSSYLAAGAR
jgi:hypothetical protein